QVKAKEFILQCVRGKVEKRDLSLRIKTGATTFDLPAGQAGLAQQRLRFDSRRPHAGASEACHEACGGWHRGEPFALGIAHAASTLVEPDTRSLGADHQMF